MINSREISVIVQGAIDKKFTPKCLESIRKYLPGAEIILSTWGGSDFEGLDYDELLLNRDPGGYRHDFAAYNQTRSMNNFNRQLVSTYSGILKANRKYCLKLRSDIILKSADFLKYWDKFEIRDSKYKLFSHRILCSSLFSRENSCPNGTGFPVPFHPSDFWFFGLIKDLEDYFRGCPRQSEREASNWDFKYPNRLPYTTPLWRFAPEQCFCINWVKKYYPDLQFEDWSDWNPENIELSNSILYNNFIFLGVEQSGLYSAKYLGVESHKSNIQGLITYERFQEQYKNYCDKAYKLSKRKKDYKGKLRKHYARLIAPFCKVNSWIGEVLAVIYYALMVVFAGWRKDED